MQVEMILSGYREAIENQIFELVSFVVRNRRGLNLREVRIRCENVAREISEYERMCAEAEAILRKRAEVERDDARGVAQG